MHMNLLDHIEVPEMYNADKVHEEKMAMWPGEFMESFQRRLFWGHEKKFVLIPFKVPFSIHLLSIHHAESSLKDHSKVQAL